MTEIGQILRIRLERGLVKKETMKQMGKYLNYGQGKNWMAIIRPSYGMGFDRQFLENMNGEFAYDTGIVQKGNIVEIAYDYFVGGSHPNHFKSKDTVKCREFYVVEEVTDDVLILKGGFPNYNGILNYKALLEEEENDRKMREMEYPFPA